MPSFCFELRAGFRPLAAIMCCHFMGVGWWADNRSFDPCHAILVLWTRGWPETIQKWHASKRDKCFSYQAVSLANSNPSQVPLAAVNRTEPVLHGFAIWRHFSEPVSSAFSGPGGMSCREPTDWRRAIQLPRRGLQLDDEEEKGEDPPVEEAIASWQAQTAVFGPSTKRFFLYRRGDMGKMRVRIFCSRFWEFERMKFV